MNIADLAQIIDDEIDDSRVYDEDCYQKKKKKKKKNVCGFWPTSAIIHFPPRVPHNSYLSRSSLRLSEFTTTRGDSNPAENSSVKFLSSTAAYLIGVLTPSRT